MNPYETEHTVTLSLGDWLTLNVAIWDAVYALRARGSHYTAKEVRAVYDRIAAQNRSALRSAHRDLLAITVSPAPPVSPEQISFKSAGAVRQR